ncbi:hypothetical protein [Nostoc sp.]|uniref:hypothetical protein n=1 Tax=Nostoc sp. TaxID=1180 RepID=UPI002FF542E4
MQKEGEKTHLFAATLSEKMGAVHQHKNWRELSDTLTGGSANDQFIYQTLSYSTNPITDFDPSQDKLVFTDLFKSQGYSSSNPIADGNLKFVQSGTSTLVEVLISYSPSYSDFSTFATLDNFTATNLVVGSNVIV